MAGTAASVYVSVDDEPIGVPGKTAVPGGRFLFPTDDL
jgi:hypothetical protein